MSEAGYTRITVDFTLAAEDALLALAPGQLVCSRPSCIRPLRGASSSVALYKVGYTLMRPLEPLLKAMGQKTDTVELGRALLAGVMGLAEGTIIESRELEALAGRLPVG